jgi:drug/metabolite transporter (DMT)-like permease
MTSYRVRAYTLLIVVVLLWGVAGPVIKFTLQGIDPLPFLSYRFTLAGIFSFIYFIVKGIKIPKKKEALMLAVSYAILAIPLALGALFYGLDQSTVLDLTLIGAVGPLIVTLGAAVFYKDHITHQEKIGISLVLIGVILNSFYPLFVKNGEVEFTGNLFLILYLFSDSSAVLIAKKAVRDKIPSITLTNLAFIIGAITIIPLTIAIYGAGSLVTAVTTLPLKYHLGVWYMALLSGNLAYFLYVKGQKSIEASEAVLFNYAQPVIMVPLALFWLHEKLTPAFIIGASIITTGLIIAEYKRH